MSQVLEDEIKERLLIKKLEKLSIADSIGNTYVYTTDEHQNIFVKTNATLNAPAMFAGELESLKKIQETKAIKVPKPITVIYNFDDKNTSAIVMEYLHINLLKPECARKLGADLANLHDYNNKVKRYEEKAIRWIGRQAPSAKQLTEQTEKTETRKDDSDEDGIIYSKHQIRVGPNSSESTSQHIRNDGASEYEPRFIPEPNIGYIDQFGFDIPTACGIIPQVNEWTKDWVSFYSRHRLDVTIRSLLSDHSDRNLHELWSSLQLKVDRLFMDYEYRGSGEGEITPALLHGDLWSGNAAQLSDGSDACIYDPASFYGHSEYEFAIVRMFKGFPSEFEKSYFEIMPKKKNFEKRNKLYQLFHHLNHWNIFGSGYRNGTLAIMKELNSMV